MKYNNFEHFYIWKTFSKQKDKQTQNETYHYRKKNMVLGVLKKLCMSSLEKVFLCNFYLYHAMVQKLKPKQTHRETDLIETITYPQKRMMITYTTNPFLNGYSLRTEVYGQSFVYGSCMSWVRWVCTVNKVRHEIGRKVRLRLYWCESESDFVSRYVHCS